MKIAEKRRRSVIALNSSIQNSDTAIQRVFNPKQNGQFCMQMEEIKECPETLENPKKEVMEENRNDNSLESTEQSQERAVELPLEDIEGEATEDEQIIAADGNPNENQINGQNRCDSGFGEPGGSMSNRSSLLSSNSVRLPVDASQTPPLQCGINCDCGQPNCNGQGAADNSEPCQEESIESIAVPQGSVMSSILAAPQGSIISAICCVASELQFTLGICIECNIILDISSLFILEGVATLYRYNEFTPISRR